MYNLLIFFGWLIAKVPEPLVKGFCWILGTGFYLIPSSRRHMIYSNLHHAFPNRSKEWLDNTAKKICHRTLEMGLFTLASPHFSNERMKKIFSVSQEKEEKFKELLSRKKPILGFATHFSMIEAFNVWPALASFEFPEMGIMFRPHKNPKINKMILKHRSRFGIKMFARKEGLIEIGKILKRGGFGAILFDQNTREFGSLMPFFGRVTSATELPGLMCKKYGAIPIGIASYRTEFWRASTYFEELDAPIEPKDLTLKSNQWLEHLIENNDDFLEDWLWTHNRWKILSKPAFRLGMKHKKTLIDWSSYDVKKARFAILHHNFSKVEKQAQAFLKILRTSRPDAEIMLIGKNTSEFQNNHRNLVDFTYELPENKNERLKLSTALRDIYLDLILIPEDNETLRKLAKKTRTPQVFGVNLTSKKHRSLTQNWHPENPQAWKNNPNWIEFGKNYGLEIKEEIEA